jgi:hypothetical protein
MTLPKRLLMALPFAIATLLTVLLVLARPLHWHTEHVAVYCFVFAAPWVWLIERGWFGDVHSRWAQAVVGYTLLLWIPALLYSACLWLLLRLSGPRAGRASD